MKKVLFFIAMLALTSCATAYQQIASISSSQMALSDEGDFRYNDGVITVSYNFWAQNGQVSFIINNDSDKDVYVDLGRSFLVVNGMTFDYFQNRTYSSNTSNTVSSSSSYGVSNTASIASSLAVAFASAYGGSASGMGMSFDDGFTQTRSASRRASHSSTVVRGLEFTEKEGVWIPAHSSRHFCEFSLMDVPYRRCGLARNPSKREEAVLSFSEYDSPYVFNNMLMLVIDGEERRLSNSFYVGGLQNILWKESHDEVPVVNCDGSKTGSRVWVSKYQSANKFYINYEMNANSRSSSDRLGKKSVSTPSTSTRRNPFSRR